MTFLSLEFKNNKQFENDVDDDSVTNIFQMTSPADAKPTSSMHTARNAHAPAKKQLNVDEGRHEKQQPKKARLMNARAVSKQFAEGVLSDVANEVDQLKQFEFYYDGESTG